MKKLLFFVAAVTILFTACKKEKVAPYNYIKIGNETITLVDGTYWQGDLFWLSGVYLSSVNLNDYPTYNGKLTTLSFSIDSLKEGTYTYRSANDPDFSKSRNFGGFNIVAHVDYSSTNNYEVGGVSYTDPDTGTLEVKLTPDGYTFKFDLTYDTVTVTGQYSQFLDIQR